MAEFCLTQITLTLPAAANLAKFRAIVAIVRHALFNTISRLLNAWAQELPNRNHGMRIYTLTIFTTGTLLGVAILEWQKQIGRASARPPHSVGGTVSVSVGVNAGRQEPYSSRRRARTIGPTL